MSPCVCLLWRPSAALGGKMSLLEPKLLFFRDIRQFYRAPNVVILRGQFGAP